jgi:hypothetical protein
MRVGTNLTEASANDVLHVEVCAFLLELLPPRSLMYSMEDWGLDPGWRDPHRRSLCMLDSLLWHSNAKHLEYL